MTDDEDEESFEVERILYQKQGPHPVTGRPVTLYLVKWEGYPEEECSWEPRDNFDGTDIFEAWAKQWQEGDILDPVDLKRVQDQMDAFNAQNESANESGHSDESDEGSDTIYHVASETEPPPKRQKLIHDAPLLTKKSAEKKGIARPIARRSTTPPGPNRAKPSDDRLHSPLRGPERVKTAAPPLHGPANTSKSIRPKPIKPLTAPRGTTKGGIPLARKSGPTQPVGRSDKRPNMPSEPPPKFHAIDLPQRKRADEETERKRAEKRAEKLAENNKGKPFRNLQHQNAARKKRREPQYAPPPPPPSRPVPAQDATPSTEIGRSESLQNDSAMTLGETEDQAGRDEVSDENRAAKMFFSDSDESIKQEDTDDAASEPTPQQEATNTWPQTAQLIPPCDVGPAVPPPVDTHPKLVVDTQNEKPLTTIPPNEETAQRATLSEQQISTTPTPRDGVALQGNVHPERLRRNSLFKQHLPTKLLSNTVPSVLTNVAAVQSAVDSPALTEIRPQPESSNLVSTNPSFWQDRRTSSVPGHQMLRIKDGHMTRELLKSDLLCHVMFQNQWIGAVQLEHVSEEYRRRILHAKVKDNKQNQLTLHFEDEMSHIQYTQRSSWFSYYDTGTLEPFEDSNDRFMALAAHLESNSNAAVWYHPSEDFMGVIYPCKSPEWRELGSKPGRTSEGRLCVAFRPRFREPPPPPSTQHKPMSNESPVQVADPRRRSMPTVIRRDSQNGNAVVKFPPVQPQNQSNDDFIRQTSSASAVQKVNTGEAKVIDRPSTIDDDAMDVDKPPATTTNSKALLNNIPTPAAPVQTLKNSFPGLDRNHQHLASVPKPGAERRKVWVLLVYNSGIEDYAQQVRDWLINNGQPWAQILDYNDRVDKDQFRSAWKQDTWVILFEKRYQINRFTGCAVYVVRNEYVLCWQFDYKASTIAQLGTMNLFPTGQAICMSEACYTTKPRQALNILKVLKHYIQEVQKPYMSSALVLPPKIISVCLEEARLTENDADKKALNDLAAFILGLMTLKSTSVLDDLITSTPNLGEFNVIETEWSAVYKNMPEKRATGINDIQRQNRDREGNLNLWFSAWALQNLHRHRKFFGIRAVDATGLHDEQHVQWSKIAEYVQWIDSKNLSTKKKAQTRERGRTENLDDERARSRSLSIGSSTMRTPTTPAFRP